MSREAKIFEPNVLSVQETITHYEAFGWELLSINGKQIVMSRETQNPVYSELVKYQAEYEKIAAECEKLVEPDFPNKPLPIFAGVCVGTFMLFVVPCALYVTYKILEKKKYNKSLRIYKAAHKNYVERRLELLGKMKAIHAESRDVFFLKKA